MNAMIAMSGGVDSSVAAYFMKQKGYDCIGATMLLVGDSLPGACGNEDSIADAKNICSLLGIPFHIMDMRNDFCKCVVDPFVKSYELGYTPNPCIECNKYLKFGLLLQKAAELNCELIVTGHYAAICKDESTGRYLLCKAADEAKDQSYFLYSLTQKQLSHIAFPLGELRKSEIRKIAEAEGFVNAKKHDSQDICFIPGGDYRKFIRRYTGKNYPAGDYIDLNGNVLGRHNGAVGYTIGQRKGLGIALGAPAYVCSKDMIRNTVTLGPDSALYSNTLWASDWNFFPFERLTDPVTCYAKARSRHIPQKATAYPEADGRVRVEFEEPQRALTPGQAVVLYDGNIVIGGGTIRKIG